MCGRLPHGDKESRVEGEETLRHGRLWRPRRPTRAPGRSSFQRHAVCGQGLVDIGRDLNWSVQFPNRPLNRSRWNIIFAVCTEAP